MYYVSLEVSSLSFECAVLNETGKLIKRITLPVSLKAVRNVLKTLKGSIAMVFEEGELASWLYRNLVRDVDQIVVAEPWYNRLIYDTDSKTDDLDAVKLVKLFRGGFIQPVHHTHDETRTVFKQHIYAYHDTTKQLTRCKNQIKAVYRQQGIIIKAQKVFNLSKREEYLSKLTLDNTVSFFYDRLDLLSKHKERLNQEIKKRSKPYPEIAWFMDLPGVGLLTAATFFSVIDEPHRFARKQQLWAYCHLGKGCYQSGNTFLNKKQKRGNRYLKSMALRAATRAIRCKPNPYRSQYVDYVEVKGKRPQMAKRIVARHLITTMWTMWRRGEQYRG